MTEIELNDFRTQDEYGDYSLFFSSDHILRQSLEIGFQLFQGNLLVWDHKYDSPVVFCFGYMEIMRKRFSV